MHQKTLVLMFSRENKIHIPHMLRRKPAAYQKLHVPLSVSVSVARAYLSPVFFSRCLIPSVVVNLEIQISGEFLFSVACVSSLSPGRSLSTGQC